MGYPHLCVRGYMAQPPIWRTPCSWSQTRWTWCWRPCASPRRRCWPHSPDGGCRLLRTTWARQAHPLCQRWPRHQSRAPGSAYAPRAKHASKTNTSKYNAVPLKHDMGHDSLKSVISSVNKKSHRGDKTVVRCFYLHKGISYTRKTASLYWVPDPFLKIHTFLTIGISIIKIRRSLYPMLKWSDLCIERASSFSPQYSQETTDTSPPYKCLPCVLCSALSREVFFAISCCIGSYHNEIQQLIHNDADGNCIWSVAKCEVQMLRVSLIYLYITSRVADNKILYWHE